MPRIQIRWIIAGFMTLTLLCIGLYLLPPVNERISWQVASLRTKLYYRFNPPDQVVLSPDQQIEIIVQATMDAINAASQAGVTASPTATAEPTSTPAISPTPTLSPTPLPPKVTLSGIKHEYQSFNNCGPASLSMLLSYWGWQGDQRDTKAVLRPNEDDANVMLAEMVDYVTAYTNLKAMVRLGGSLDLIKQFIAAGFPVMIEMGHHPPDDWWMGHYVVVSGYDDAWSALITQDSLIMADLPLPYSDIEAQWWRDFNRPLLVVYPPERENEVLRIFGENRDLTRNLELTLSETENEIPVLQGRDLFFALYNKAALQLLLNDPNNAAGTFDQAFVLYNTLDEKQRPWRLLWYREEAYQTYYEVGRYQAVIDLTSATLSMLSKRGLEESHYWRGMAYEALGESEKAISDYQIAIQLRPTYQEAITALNRLQ
jgi:tetratricopeptide (TPR) repeat protein